MQGRSDGRWLDVSYWSDKFYERLNILCLYLQQMTVHVIPGTGFDCNVFLVSGDSPILVDAGTGVGHARLMDRIMKSLRSRTLQAIILTHRHIDHVGGAAALSRDLNAPVYAHRDDSPPIREGSDIGTEAPMFGLKMHKVEVHDLMGGEVFSTGDHDLTVIWTPGHTRGGISLFDYEKRVLFSGDTVFAGGVGRWDLSTGDRGQLVGSIRKLLALDPLDLYPGHGPCALGDASQQLKDALMYLGYS